MILKSHQKLTGLAILFLLVTVNPVLLHAQASIEDYQRANNLQEQFEGKALNVVDDATWIDDTHHLWYRKTVQGGRKFIRVDAESQNKRDAFDHERMAEILSTNRDTIFSALELPFDEIKFIDNESAVKFEVGDSVYTCTLSDYICDSEQDKDKNGRRGWNPWSEEDEPEGSSDKRISSVSL